MPPQYRPTPNPLPRGKGVYFITVPLRPHHPRPRRGFTLVEITSVVFIVGILLAISLPSFVSARETSRTKSYISNLDQIYSAKIQCCIDNQLADTSTATFLIDGVTASTPGPNGTYQLVTLSGNSSYMRQVPTCASGGVYSPGLAAANPTYSVATAATSTNYQSGGRCYHGM